MRILMATGFNFIPQSVGGSEISTDELCRGAMAAGHTCAVVCALAPTEDTLYVVNRLKSKIGRKLAPPDTVNGYRVYRGWQTKESLEEVCRDFRPDVVVVQSGETAKIVNESLRIGYPTVVYVRDIQFDSHGGRYPNHPYLRALANSNFTAQSLEREFGLKSRVLPPSIDHEKYRVPGDRMTKEHVLFINPHPAKGLDIAIELARNNADIPFLFLRSWRLDRQLEGRVSEVARSLHNVTLMPSTKDMRSIYASTRLVLVPSIWGEAWCRVVSEAQVSGIPALASDRGGLPESVGDGGILISPSSDIDTWTQQLRALFFQPEVWQRYSSNALKSSMREELTPEYTVRGILQTCEELLSSTAV